jgi:hypothetical protein
MRLKVLDVLYRIGGGFLQWYVEVYIQGLFALQPLHRREVVISALECSFLQLQVSAVTVGIVYKI